ncbi:glycerophosphodiester phosphodiesterase family protein [uncultured Paraglaciecola sp.]|uniref:glycerophosphodiester phosphodiesterase family protein n=1 Tax=uncultured Paraglaciecola sp. TaxID=1765024 RepID=UPI002602E9B3|nr:glycerophosphodiester phosphodiesterase family protein [uncultured Paraglaciecola sp.]
MKIRLLVTLIVLSLSICKSMAIASTERLKTKNKSSQHIVCRSDLVMNSIKSKGTNRILVAAHRGAHNTQPENSLPSIDKAIDLGVDIIELDVRLSADGIPVLMHDKSVNRTTNGTGLISNKSLAEIRKLRLLFDGKPTAHHVPTLAEVLVQAKDRIIVNIDIKAEDILAISKVVEEAQAFSYTMFFNDDLALLSKLRTIRPDTVIMPLASNDKEARFIASKFDIEIVHLKENYISSGLSIFLDDNNSAGWVNALGKIDSFLKDGSLTASDHFIDARVDVIQTDRPEELLAILSNKSLRPNYAGLNRTQPCGLVIAKEP